MGFLELRGRSSERRSTQEAGVQIRGLLRTFEEADALFPFSGDMSSTVIWESTGRSPRGPTTFNSSHKRFQGMTSFKAEQLPYIRSTNALLLDVLENRYSDSVVASYKAYPQDDIYRFDRAVYDGIESCLAMFAQLHPQYIPVLRHELADGPFGVQGFMVTIAAIRYSVNAFTCGETTDIEHRVFPKHSGSDRYGAKRANFIGPRDSSWNKDEAVECLGTGLAATIFEGAAKAHKKLSRKMLGRKRKVISMKPDPNNTVPTSEKLRTFVIALYQYEKEKRKAA